MAVSDAQKLAVLDQQINQFGVELYQWQLNKTTAERLGLPTDTADQAIHELTTAIAVREEEKATLEPAVEVVA